MGHKRVRSEHASEPSLDRPALSKRQRAVLGALWDLDGSAGLIRLAYEMATDDHTVTSADETRRIYTDIYHRSLDPA